MSIVNANKARLQNELNKQYRFSDGSVLTMGQWIKKNSSLVTEESDGMIDYSRTKFNRMNYHEQAKYINNLKNKRYYWVNNIKISKLIYDYISNEVIPHN